jgi:LPS-assembly lipoprotein
MNFIEPGRLIRAAFLLSAALAMTACGFHLRGQVALPPAMQRVHLAVNGGGELERSLARALRDAGAVVEDRGGAGIAELNVPTTAFSTETLSSGGYVRISQYTVHYNVQFSVLDGEGQMVVPLQRITLSREYTFDATQAVGNAAQVEQIQQSLQTDMVQAILFRLQAAGKHQMVTPANASSAP